MAKFFFQYINGTYIDGVGLLPRMIRGCKMWSVREIIRFRLFFKRKDSSSEALAVKPS